MRPDQIELVLSALDSLYQQIGLAGYDEAAQVARSELAKAGDPDQMINAKIAMAVGEYIFQQQADAGWQTVLGKIKGKTFSTRDELRKALVKAPDLTNEDLAWIEKFRHAPKHVRASLKEVMQQIRPKGGHPWVVPPSDYGKICDEVTAKFRAGASQSGRSEASSCGGPRMQSADYQLDSSEETRVRVIRNRPAEHTDGQGSYIRVPRFAVTVGN